MKRIQFKNVLDKLNAYTLLGIAFFIPFNSILNRYMLGIFLVSSLILYVSRPGTLLIKKYKGFIALFLLFLIYSISFLYSYNLSLAWIDLEKKLPLCLLPLAFMIIKPGQNKKHQLFWAFLAGVVSVTLICAGYFIFHSLSDAHFHRVLINHPFYQMYSKFYIFGNTNYYAVYLNMGVLLILGMLGRTPDQIHKNWMKWFMYFGLFLFVALSLVISSRSGIVAMVILLVFSVFYLVRIPYLRLVSLALLITAGFYIAQNYRFNNYIRLFDRMIHSSSGSVKEKDLLEISALRLVFWKASLEIIRENIWFGVGTGDVKAQIKAKYKEMGVYEELHENDDPHNQFLRTFIATGLPGFLALAGVFVFGFWAGIQNKDYFLMAFLILIVIHLLFKSMLFREDGVVFFSFFYGLLYICNFLKPSEI